MASSRFIQAAVVCGVALAALGGCGGSDSQSGSTSSAVTPTTPASTTTTTTPPVTTKTPVSISGTPATSVKVGQSYAFAPQVATQAAAQFSIQNKPAWASFDTKSGKLSGTPGAKDVGTYHGVKISAVANGVTAALSPFDVTVQAATQAAPQSTPVTLSWTAPSAASGQLEGYRVYYGTSAGSLTHVVSLSASDTSYVVNNLASGTWYFAVTTLSANDVESTKSAVVPAEI